MHHNADQSMLGAQQPLSHLDFSGQEIQECYSERNIFLASVISLTTLAGLISYNDLGNAKAPAFSSLRFWERIMSNRQHFHDALVRAPIITTSDLVPRETIEKLVHWGTDKTRLSLDRLWILGILAGAYIAFGGAFFTLVMTGVPLGHGPSRVLGGLCFSMGLLLVAMTGAELSTGNCMALAARAAGRISIGALSQLLALSFLANVTGAVLIAGLLGASGLLDGTIGHVTARIAEAKLGLPLQQAFVRGVLCNALVCLAVWLILSARTLTGKLLGLVFPITAFVALGFEHSIANVYLFPAGFMAGAKGTMFDTLVSLGVVTLGNLIGGLLVAAALWLGHGQWEQTQS